MRKRVFGSIFLTSLVTLLLTTGLLLLAVHAGLTNDMRQRLITESSYLSAVDDIREELEECSNAIKKLGLKLEDVREFPVDGTNHALIVLRKVAHTPTAYPRRYAKIKQTPL